MCEHSTQPEDKTASTCMAQDEPGEKMLGKHGKKSPATNGTDCYF